jgi:hypothetical protein
VKECAFEDVYYEHCSYFSPGSLARLFRKCGFAILSLTREYDDQYLVIEAKPSDRPSGVHMDLEDDPGRMKHYVDHFKEKFQKILQTWKSRLQELKGAGKRTVLWGSGSKAVSFLTTLRIHDEVDYVVDINPHKHGFYMPGTNQQIVSPKFLETYEPDAVIVMNAIYRREIQGDLAKLRLHPEVMAL